MMIQHAHIHALQTAWILRLQGRYFTLKISLLYGCKMRPNYCPEQHQKQTDIKLTARCLKRIFYNVKGECTAKIICTSMGQRSFCHVEMQVLRSIRVHAEGITQFPSKCSLFEYFTKTIKT
jgi:hypothetical protein